MSEQIMNQFLKGFWFDIDGIDGAGKTTLCDYFYRFFSGLDDPRMKFKPHPALMAREPTYISEYGIEIRKILKTDPDPITNGEKLLDLYFKDRIFHQKNLIVPCLNNGVMVINDRGELSSFAFQYEQFKRTGMDSETAFRKILTKSKQVMRPNLYMIINTPAKIAIARMRAEGRGTQKFEREIDFLEAVRKNYLEVAEKLSKLNKGYNIKIIDGTQTPKKVFEQSLKYLEQEY